MRQSEQGQLIVPDLCIGNCGADNRFLFHGESPFRGRNGLAFFSGFCYNQCSEKAKKRNSSDRAHSERKRQVKAFCRIYREPVLELCTEEKKIHQGKFIS